MRLLIAAILLVLISGSVEARGHRQTVDQSFDRHSVRVDASYSVQGTAASPRRTARSLQRRSKHAKRRVITGFKPAIAQPSPKPGTLGAYRVAIAKNLNPPAPKKDESRVTADAPVSRSGLGNIQGLKGYFIAKLAQLRAAMPKGLGFSVGSGYRSYAEQARLHALKPRLAAAPGRSKHEKGLAGDLKFASSESARWVHRNSRKHGLTFPMAYEPWHIEPVGVTRVARNRHHRVRYAKAG